MKYSGSLVIVSISLLLSACDRDTPFVIVDPALTENVSIPVSTSIYCNFDFFPDCGAVWEFQSSTPYPAIRYRSWTYFGRDTLINTKNWQDRSAPSSLKVYTDLLTTGYRIHENDDTIHIPERRLSRFRIDRENRRVMHQFTYQGQAYESLKYDFSVAVGDTADFIIGYGLPVIVVGIDSIEFGNRHLKRIMFKNHFPFGNSWIIEGIGGQADGIVSSGLPRFPYMKRFSFGDETLEFN